MDGWMMDKQVYKFHVQTNSLHFPVFLHFKVGQCSTRYINMAWILAQLTVIVNLDTDDVSVLKWLKFYQKKSSIDEKCLWETNSFFSLSHINRLHPYISREYYIKRINSHYKIPWMFFSEALESNSKFIICSKWKCGPGWALNFPEYPGWICCHIFQR